MSPVLLLLAVRIDKIVLIKLAGAAKTISKYQGLKSFHPEFNMIEAQIQLLDVKNINEVLNLLKSKRDEIINVANTFCERMVKRGGGVRDVSFRTIITKVENIVIHLHINVCDSSKTIRYYIFNLSVGANCANTVAEGVAPFIRELTKTRIGLKILSNLSSNRLTTVN